MKPTFTQLISFWSVVDDGGRLFLLKRTVNLIRNQEKQMSSLDCL